MLHSGYRRKSVMFLCFCCTFGIKQLMKTKMLFAVKHNFQNIGKGF